MEIKHLSTEEILALADNRFDVIIDDAFRQGSTLTFSPSPTLSKHHSLEYLNAKIEALKGIRFLLAEYERRVKGTIKAKQV